MQRYSRGTLEGGWQEDMVLESLSLADQAVRREAGTLLSQRRAAERGAMAAPAALAPPRPGGGVEWGDAVQLQTADAGLTLSVNAGGAPGEELEGGAPGRRRLSLAPRGAPPAARNVLTLVPVTPLPAAGAPHHQRQQQRFVRFGDVVALRFAALGGGELTVQTATDALPGPSRGARLGGGAAATTTGRGAAAAATYAAPPLEAFAAAAAAVAPPGGGGSGSWWRLAHPSGDALLWDGVPVERRGSGGGEDGDGGGGNGGRVVLVHVATGRALAAAQGAPPFPSQFGAEPQVEAATLQPSAGRRVLVTAPSEGPPQKRLRAVPGGGAGGGVGGPVLETPSLPDPAHPANVWRIV